MTLDTPIAAAKQAMRGEMTARRDAIPSGQRAAGARAIAEAALGFASPRAGAVVSGYVAMRSELDPEPLMERLSAAGYPLALPVTPQRGRPLAFRKWAPGDALVDGEFGVRVPQERAGVVQPDILLVPLLAFDRLGYRLGYGAGYFDRTLAGLRAQKQIIAIGIAFDEQEVEIVPHDDYDQRLDWVLTTSGALGVEGT